MINASISCYKLQLKLCVFDRQVQDNAISLIHFDCSVPEVIIVSGEFILFTPEKKN